MITMDVQRLIAVQALSVTSVSIETDMGARYFVSTAVKTQTQIQATAVDAAKGD